MSYTRIPLYLLLNLSDMQAITIAIGKTGINFFTQQYLLSTIQKLLGNLKPPDRSIPVAGFKYGSGLNATTTVSNLTIQLSQGSLNGFSPSFQQIVQGLSGTTPIFTLSFGSSAFTANYKWTESYHWDSVTVENGPDGPTPVYHSGNTNTPFTYNPSFSQLAITINVTFAFNSTTQTWQITVQQTSGQAQGASTNIPSGSVVTHQTGDCSGQHISAATAQMIGAIDFATPINTLISGILATIPGSGNLGNNIVYDFSLSAPDQLVFPNNDGIQMGVRGGASYNGTAFAGGSPPSLPLPTPPGDADTHHLNIYVSNYEVDALNWAFFEAGKLNTIVNASDLADPEVLKVKTYVASCPPLTPYSGRAMQAKIVPNAAPTTAFQMVYELSSMVMEILEKQLPTSVYNDLTGLQGNNYASKTDLESDLTSVDIASSYFPAIEAAAQAMGMVVTHDINYTLTILDFQAPEPTIEFNVKRVDILSNLSLGLGGANQQTQTMQFQFQNISWVENFISSSIPKLNASIFSNLWLTAGEPQYAALLTAMGKNGTPLPVMQGFQFDFTNAILSIQENYISILANVEFNSASAIQVKI